MEANDVLYALLIIALMAVSLLCITVLAIVAKILRFIRSLFM